MFLLAGLPATAGAGTRSNDRLSELADRAPSRSIEAIVGLRPGTSAAEARRLVRRHGGRVTGELGLIRALTVRIGARQAEKLRDRAGIASVAPNAAVKPKTVSVRKLESSFPKAVDAPTTWKDFGVTGRGIGVAVIDTGIAGQLPDFRVGQKDTASRVVASAVVHPGASTAGDAFGHGTHVAGIIAANGTARAADDPLFGKRIGIAPNAHLVSVKVSDDEGTATVIDVIRGLQFVVDHKDTYGIRVVNLSLESTEPESYKTDALAAAVEAAWFRGLVVVTAAGNRGTSAEAVKTSPGNDPFVISVGGFDDKSTLTASDDTIAEWSSRGTTQDGFSKPELYAPGSKIISNLAPRSKFESMCPSCIVDGAYIRAGGAVAGSGRHGQRQQAADGQRRPGAQPPDRFADPRHRLQPLFLEPLLVEQRLGPAGGELGTLELELHLPVGRRGREDLAVQLEPELMVDRLGAVR